MSGGDMNTMKKCSTCSTLYAGELCPKCVASFAQTPSDPTAPPEELPLKPGQTFHGYEILELLGRGGMGVVYKARQPALDRMIALKILPQKMALDPDFQNRFIREAKALGSLNHPNLVAVYDFGAEGGLFYFAMEYVDGTNLRHILRERKLTPEQAIKIVPHLCDALEYAHAEGVVHRDIKPENILMDKKGRIKIADFGLAKLTGGDSRSNMLTMTNMVMGTPHYMAPEQVENPKSVDHRADIYAVGVVFYEMLTGELPIGRFELPSKKVQIDVRLDDVVLKTLEKQPDRRYQKAGDVKDAVTRATTVGTSVESYSPTVITPKPAVKSPAKQAIIAGTIVACLALVVALSAILKKNDDPQPVPVTGTTTTVVPEGPVDLAPLYFGPTERPLSYAFAQIEKDLPRNPFPAKDEDEIERLVKLLDGIGLQNISHKDVRQGYLAAWFRWTAAFVALDTPLAERLEREFLALSLDNKWSHRKGSLVVLAWVPRAYQRDVFVDLVSRLQKKLGIPVVTPEVPIENLKLERSSLPSSEWAFQEGGPPMPARPNRADQYQVVMATADGEDTLELRVWVGKTDKDAQSFVTERLGFQDRRKIEVHQVGRTAAGLALRGEDFSGFEKLAVNLRRSLGLAERTFDTVALTESEMPAGFTIDKSLTDIARILQETGISGVRSSEITRALLLRMKPAGQIVLLEVPESSPRSAIEQHFRKSGASWYGDDWVFGVEGPDDETLDALENRMREKFGWDRNKPRPTKLHHLRLEDADLPQGLTMGPITAEKRVYSGEIKGANLVFPFRFQEAFDYGDVTKVRNAAPYKPGDILIVKDFMVVYVGVPGEPSWPLADGLEALLRRKMRMGPPTVDEFALRTTELPPGSAYLEQGGGKKNPMQEKVRSGDWTERWQAIIDPARVQVALYGLRDAGKNAAVAETQRKFFETDSRKALTFVKGGIVAVISGSRTDDTAFKAIAEILRAKFRLKAN